jgi:hypothetical protein
MNTVRFIRVREKTNLLADKNKNPRGQRQNTRKNTWDGDSEEGHETDDDQIYREQKHTDVFREVHVLSILIVRTDYNLKTVAPLSLVQPKPITCWSGGLFITL